MTDRKRAAPWLGTPPGRPSPYFEGTLPAELLTPAEVAAIIGGCSSRSHSGIRNRALLTLLYRSGIRISEAVGAPARPERRFRGRDGEERIQAARPAIPPLRLADVDQDERTIRVLHGKGNKATTRHYHASADDALGRWVDTRKAMGLRGGPLFCTLDGGQMQAQYVRGLLKRLAAEAAIDKRVHPHGFRHTFAVELRRSGTDIAVISKLLGHSSIAVTARYLDHLTNDEAAKGLAAAKLPPLEF
jgi:site-specific recombinase XerD